MKTIKSFAEAAVAMGLAPENKPEKTWAEKQQKKFLTCPACGGRMTHPLKTNVVTCENYIKDEATGKSRPCGFVRLLDKRGQDFSDYIF